MIAITPLATGLIASLALVLTDLPPPKVIVEGAPNDALGGQLTSIATTTTMTNASLSSLRRRAVSDAQTMQLLLQSAGYYAAQLDTDVRRADDSRTVTYRVTPGDRFQITQHTIQYSDEAMDANRPQSFADIGVTVTDDPSGDTLAALETALISYLRENGFPQARRGQRSVDARFADGTGTAVYQLSSGPSLKLGDVEVIGDLRTTTNHIRSLRTFTEGEVYKQSDIDKYKKHLQETDLFSKIQIDVGEPDANGVAPLILTLEESKRRTVGAGVSYSTDVGPGVTAFWENRNFRGKADEVNARLNLSAPEQSLGVNYNKPLPRLPGSWGLFGIMKNEDTDAFSAQSAGAGAEIAYLPRDGRYELSARIRYTFADILNSDGTQETFQSASFPITAALNTENDRINPTRGHSARFVVTPFAGSETFTKIEFSGATRKAFGASDKFIIAGRALYSGSVGTDDDGLPATERYFAGGGGSIRGYAYQKAGPIDANGDPAGGNSAIEANLEARFAVTEEIQLAVFADAGTVFDADFGAFDEDILIGAGAGVRYFTPIGPLRFDVAVPVTPRTETSFDADGVETVTFEDDPIQVYIAIGQPF